MFLTADDLATLTGIKGGAKGKTRCQRQIDALRQMGIPFFVNAAGRPVVTRAAIEGRQAESKTEPREWSPAVLRA
ncbi:MAG: DUF4224 domain-containing protein [Betaproteobacteria bacterium]|nr:DUF4224 domain-containing protein [Betaproteobacteria bacterium]